MRKNPLLLTLVLLRALWFLPTITPPGRGIPHGKVITETRQYHNKSNQDEYKEKKKGCFKVG